MHDLRVSRYLSIGRCAGDRSDNEAVTPQELARPLVILVQNPCAFRNDSAPVLLVDILHKYFEICCLLR